MRFRLNSKLIIPYILLIVLFINLFLFSAHSQQLNVTLPNLEGAAGQDIFVDVTISGNTEAAQGGIFIVFDPEVVSIEDAFQISEGSEIEESEFFITPSIKDLCLVNGEFISDCTGTLGTINTMGVSSGIFPKNFPPDLIPDGVVLRIIFTINSDANIGDMTDLIINTQSFFHTSFGTSAGNNIPEENLNLVNGSITVVEGSSGSGCTIAAENTNTGNSLLHFVILLLPLLLISIRKTHRKRYFKYEDKQYV